MNKQSLIALMAVKCELSKQLDVSGMIGTDIIKKKEKYRRISVEINEEIDRLYSQSETIDSLMSTINHLNDLLKIRNDEISKLRGI